MPEKLFRPNRGPKPQKKKEQSTAKRRWLGSGVSTKLLTRTTAQLAVLEGAGIQILRALRICEQQLRPGPFKAVMGAVADDVESGTAFSLALAKHPVVFNDLYVNLIRAGEKSGELGQMLSRLAGFLEAEQRIKAKVKEALTYPAVVLLFACGVVGFVLVVIVPKFEEIFRQFNQELPAVTKTLIAVSSTVATYWYLFLGLPVLAYVGYRFALRHARVRLFVDGCKLRSPIFGDILRKTIIARFSRTFGILLQSGVLILEAIESVQQTVTNTVMARVLGQARSDVSQGSGVAPAFRASVISDDLVGNMLTIGEETGKLDTMLLRIADVYEAEVDTTVGTLFKLLEPVLIIALALVVGFIVMALFLPILKVMDSFNQQ